MWPCGEVASQQPIVMSGTIALGIVLVNYLAQASVSMFMRDAQRMVITRAGDNC